MFGKILYIGENVAYLENTTANTEASDLMNLHVIFESANQSILGEIYELDKEIIKIRLLGEFVGDTFLNGLLRKPYLNSTVRIINGTELSILVGTNDGESLVIGKHATYKNFEVCGKLNTLFGNHLAIFGNSGSGKSYGTTRIMQNIFNNQSLNSVGANIFIFDSFGEYRTAFTNIGDNNDNYCYKFVTTKKEEPTDFDLRIPINLMILDDWALLLQADTHSQLTIIETTLKYCKIFAKKGDSIDSYKNHVIGKALIAILFSSETTEAKKNQIFKVLEVCNTTEFNFDTIIHGVGYSRTLSDCFEIDSKGKFGESVLITDYILKQVNDSLENIDVPDDSEYSIDDFANALEFTLISGGFLNNKALYDSAIMLKVRLNNIIKSNYNKIFLKSNITMVDFINELVYTGNKKNQIININLEEVDDILAKVIVKIMSRFLFDFGKSTQFRAQTPFHLFLEEAHRYVQKDNDVFLLGYNIFERIAKEGRKYGVLLNIISQRPVEISDTVIAQVANFLIFKMTHPKDLKYIEEMLPNIQADIIAKQKSLQPGTCVSFGPAFKIPMIVKLELPNPEPFSSSCNVKNVWQSAEKVKPNEATTIELQEQSEATFSEENKFMPNNIN